MDSLTNLIEKMYRKQIESLNKRILSKGTLEMAIELGNKGGKLFKNDAKKGQEYKTSSHCKKSIGSTNEIATNLYLDMRPFVLFYFISLTQIFFTKKKEIS